MKMAFYFSRMLIGGLACVYLAPWCQRLYRSTMRVPGRLLMQELLAYTIIWPTDSIGLPCGKMYHSSVIPVTYARKLNWI